jgi:hypothetical protein
MMDIEEATQSYEGWLAQQITLDAPDLKYKHQQMRVGAFPFFRATFYRWAQLWPRRCPALSEGPSVLAVGDLHVENFGTWRDAEGRLVWGVNDFDEACELSYASDLVRLAVSADLAIQGSRLQITPARACEAVLAGYAAALKAGGSPFVLAEDHAWLRRAAFSELRDPEAFWARLDALSDCAAPPPSAAVCLASLLPADAPPPAAWSIGGRERGAWGTRASRPSGRTVAGATRGRSRRSPRRRCGGPSVGRAPRRTCTG